MYEQPSLKERFALIRDFGRACVTGLAPATRQVQQWLVLSGDHDLSADVNAFEQVDDVMVVHADAAV